MLKPNSAKKNKGQVKNIWNISVKTNKQQKV